MTLRRRPVRQLILALGMLTLIPSVYFHLPSGKVQPASEPLPPAQAPSSLSQPKHIIAIDATGAGLSTRKFAISAREWALA